MTIKTLNPLWAVVERSKLSGRRLLFPQRVFRNRAQARIEARSLNAYDPAGKGRMPLYYVARFVHMHEQHPDFTR